MTAAVAEVRLIPAATRGRVYGRFAETGCWTVLAGGEQAGEVWKAVRDDGTVCWMQHPHCLGLDLPCSAVTAGYSRTTKKHAASDVAAWHRLRFEPLEVPGWRLHCSAHRGRESSWLAVDENGSSRWLHLTHNEADDPRHGAMGTAGWHAVARRANRMICVHQAGSAAEAASLALEAACAVPTKEESRAALLPSAERILGSLAERPVPNC